MKKIIHNVETNEIFERNLNSDELAQIELDKVKAEVQIAKENAKKEARTNILNKLGITEEEAALLMGGI